MRRRVFISYRRDDDGGDAGRLCDRLRKRFGRRRVFFDIDSIRPSEDFPTAIRRAVGSCDALVVVIGRNWVRTPRDSSGRRTDDPDDFVRIEVATALERGIPTIPVLVGGAQMPPASQLPPSLEALATRHALEVSRKRWDYDVRLLIEAVEEVAARQGMPVWIRIALPVVAAATALTGLALATNGDPPTTSAPTSTVPAVDDPSVRHVPIRPRSTTPPPSPSASTTVARVRVPDLRGLSGQDAEDVLASAGLLASVDQDETSLAEPGTVVRTVPSAGTWASEGDVVMVLVAVGEGPGMATGPTTTIVLG